MNNTSLRKLLATFSKKPQEGPVKRSYRYSVNDRFDYIMFKDKRFLHDGAAGWVGSYTDEFHCEVGRVVWDDPNRNTTRFGVNHKAELVSGHGIVVCGEGIGLD